MLLRRRGSHNDPSNLTNSQVEMHIFSRKEERVGWTSTHKGNHGGKVGEREHGWSVR